MTKGLHRLERGWIVAALVLFSLCAFPWLDLPGPEQDELYFIPVLEPYAYGPTLYSWSWGETEIPVMIVSYAGALKAWLMAGVLAVFPPTMVTVRAFGVILGLLTIALTACFLRRHYSAFTTVSATLLLATSASFIHTMRMDWGPVALMQFLKMAALVLLAVWVTGRKPLWLAAGMFVFGLAIWDKANFIWFLAALGVAVLAVFPQETLRRLSPKTIAIALLAFTAGSWPLWQYNIEQGAATASENARFEFRPEKLEAAQKTLDGSAVLWLAGGSGLDDALPLADISSAGIPATGIPAAAIARALRTAGWARSNLTWPLMVLAVLALPLTLRTPHGRGILFALLVTLLTYAAMFVFRAGGGSAHHVVMIFPFPFIFVAASLEAISARWKLPRLAPLVVGAALVIALSLNARYLAAYTHSDGSRHFSPAIYRLVSFMGKENHYRYYFLDWGMATQTAFLGHDRGVRWEELYGVFAANGTEQERQERMSHLLVNPQNRFVTHGENRTFFPAGRARIERLAAEGRLRKVKELRERGGTVAFEIYEAAGGSSSK